MKKLEKSEGREMLDMQRNFMINVMGGFSEYEAFHMYSQQKRSENQNGLIFDIWNGIGSKIEKTDIPDAVKSRFKWKHLDAKLLALNEFATCPNSNLVTYGSDTVSVIFHVGANCGVESLHDRGMHPQMRMGNRRTWSKKSNNFIIGIGCGLENSEKKDFEDFIRRVFYNLRYILFELK